MSGEPVIHGPEFQNPPQQSWSGLNTFPAVNQGQGQQGIISAVDRAREVARQVAERQREIGARPDAVAVIDDATAERFGAGEKAILADQRELRQLLAVKLRALAASVEGINSTRPATAGEIQREVARLGDIAGALE